MNKIEIPLSKTKILLTISGAIIFVILGLYFLLVPEKFVNTIFVVPIAVQIVGIASVLFFGTACILGLRKLFDQSPGLIIDKFGIIDNSNASSVGLIEWKDIVEIKTEKIKSTRFLLIFVNNSNKYLDRVTGFKQKLMKMNMKMYGTPLSLVSNTLKYKFDDLEKLLQTKLAEQKLQNH